LRLNGHRRVTVKTLHGSFELLQQMYQASGESLGFLTLSGKSGFGYVSRGLQELVTYYSNRLGDEAVSGLVERLTGSAQLSAQSVWNIVQDTAQALSDHQASDAAGLDVVSAAPVAVDSRDRLDIYDGQATEILLMEDGILVKAQKASRAKGGSPDEAISATGRRPRPNVVNDVMVLEIHPGEFEYLFPPITRAGEFRIPLESMLLQRLQHHYASWTKPLPIVVISDGAKVIRQRLQRIFGDGVWIILDWYHLDRKIDQLMSMIGRSKDEKATHAASILGLLWEGKTVEAIDYLRTQVAVRNIDKHQELMGYLEKHQGEIIRL
jgi:hypothetical protein